MYNSIANFACNSLFLLSFLGNSRVRVIHNEWTETAGLCRYGGCKWKKETIECWKCWILILQSTKQLKKLFENSLYYLRNIFLTIVSVRLSAIRGFLTDRVLSMCFIRRQSNYSSEINTLESNSLTIKIYIISIKLYYFVFFVVLSNRPTFHFAKTTKTLLSCFFLQFKRQQIFLA